MELITEKNRIPARRAPGPWFGVMLNGGWNDRRDVFHTTFNPEAESACEVIIEAVEIIENKEPEELAPLFETIDPDALSNMIHNSSGDIEIKFHYENMEIIISSNGNLWLQRM